ncbi:type I phosphodiesterase / nucleotide pyrophosphatase [Trichuris suis]|nr:type I phosphodiesterase / nucleotide pyrophosphatase [Trichuris suis]
MTDQLWETTADTFTAQKVVLNDMKRLPNFVCFRIACILSMASILWFLSSFLMVNVHLKASQPAGKGESASWMSRLDSRCKGLPAVNFSASFVKRVVLMVVDALRAEVLESGIQYMPFLRGMITNGSGYVFKAKIQAPTVTMPRIKALTSGTIPAFLDLLFNFGSSEFADDNLLRRMRESNLSSVFYGDETWLHMFPGHFKRSEGTTSFIVTDYVEVDRNVTRHLDFELQQVDWTMMILHYLGLDHIGHSYGDKSSLISLKLQEMDNVSSIIYRTLHKNLSDFLLIVLGDHGMSDTGGHGGTSELESNVLVFTISPHLTARQLIQTVEQVDLVPTLAVLLNLPIPERNVGLLMGDLVRALIPKDGDLCTMYMINLCQFVRNIPDAISDKAAEYCLMLTFASLVSDIAYQAVQKHWPKDGDPVGCNSDISASFEQLFNDLRRLLSEHSLPYNVSSMTSALILLLILAVLFCIQYSYLITKWNGELEFASVFLTSLPVMSLASSSYIEFEELTWHFILCSLMAVLVYHSCRTPSGDVVRRRVVIVAILSRSIRELCSMTAASYAYGNSLWTFSFLRHERSFLVNFSLMLLIITFLPSAHSKVWHLCYLILSFAALSYYKLVDHENFKSTLWSTVSARSVFALAIAIIALDKLSSRSIAVSISLLQCLFLKPLHLLIYCLIVSQQVLLKRVLLELKASVLCETMLHFVLAQCAFFDTGNSNRLSTIDISVSYIGLTSYQPAISAVLIFIRTYGLCFVVWALFWRHLDRRNQHSALCFIFLLTAVPTAFYMFIVELLRTHLFVWSVFAPKLLYLSVSSIFYFLTLLLLSFLNQVDSVQ